MKMPASAPCLMRTGTLCQQEPPARGSHVVSPQAWRKGAVYLRLCWLTVCPRVQAYMVRLGTFGFSDMKGLIGALNRFAPTVTHPVLCNPFL